MAASPLYDAGGLQSLFNGKGIGLANCAHLAVDVQYNYIQANRTIAAADNIVENIAPFFNRMNIPTCWIYLGQADLTTKTMYSFYKMRQFADNDWTLPKQACSAFHETGLETTLKAADKKLLFITGFTRMICVKDTIKDAIAHEFNVVLIEDGTSPPDDVIGDPAGTVTAYSKDVFSFLTKLNKN